MHWRFLKTIYIYKVLLLFHKQFLGLTSFFEAVLTDYIQKRTVRNTQDSGLAQQSKVRPQV